MRVWQTLSHRPTFRRAATGYTLLEALVVVTMILILTAVSLPNFFDWLRQYQLQAAVQTLTNHLRAARLLAIFNGVTHEAQFAAAADGNYYQIVRNDSGTSGKIVKSIGRVMLSKRFGSVTIIVLPQSKKISFSPGGGASTATIKLENGSHAQAEIVVNNAGRVKSKYL